MMDLARWSEEVTRAIPLLCGSIREAAHTSCAVEYPDQMDIVDLTENTKRMARLAKLQGGTGSDRAPRRTPDFVLFRGIPRDRVYLRSLVKAVLPVQSDSD